MDLLTKFNIKILQSLFWSRKKEEKENFKKKKIREGGYKRLYFYNVKIGKNKAYAYRDAIVDNPQNKCCQHHRRRSNRKRFEQK